MIYQPYDLHIQCALKVAMRSPCRSKRGVVLFNETTGAHRGEGFNGPPYPLTCPGREVCAGTCGQRSIHAEMRALRDHAWQRMRFGVSGQFELLHVELAAAGRMIACDGPSCITCAREIMDVGFVAGVWLYEEIERAAGLVTPDRTSVPIARWRRYTAADFYRVTLENCGVRP